MDLQKESVVILKFGPTSQIRLPFTDDTSSWLVLIQYTHNGAFADVFIAHNPLYKYF